ncbi:MAG: ABC transporter permease [Streptosporangiaceae bacterium]|nr:ABC transporter permease [Streptosporangiaceae bacterium]
MSAATADFYNERPGVARTSHQSLALAWRTLRPLLRSPVMIVTDALRPVLLVLLFNFVFGGSITLPGGLKYISYLVPGILVQQVAFFSALTAAGMAADMTNHILDRFRSLPVARSAYLTGRVLADTARMLLSEAVIITVGVALGFRFGGGFAAGAGGLLLGVAFGVSVAWLGVATAMVVRNPELVQMVWFVSMMPLIFASSIFASPSRMPGWLQPLVRANPLSVVADAERALLLGGPAATPVWHAVAWIAGSSVVFFAWAVHRYRSLGG